MRNRSLAPLLVQEICISPTR